MTFQELTELVGRTISPVWKQIKNLEQDFITHKVVVDWSRMRVPARGLEIAARPLRR